MSVPTAWGVVIIPNILILKSSKSRELTYRYMQKCGWVDVRLLAIFCCLESELASNYIGNHGGCLLPGSCLLGCPPLTFHSMGIGIVQPCTVLTTWAKECHLWQITGVSWNLPNWGWGVGTAKTARGCQEPSWPYYVASGLSFSFWIMSPCTPSLGPPAGIVGGFQNEDRTVDL